MKKISFNFLLGISLLSSVAYANLGKYDPRHSCKPYYDPENTSGRAGTFWPRSTPNTKNSKAKTKITLRSNSSTKKK